MPFELYSAPATSQRCMLSIFSDMVENCLEIFMDDLTVFGNYLLHVLIIYKEFWKSTKKGTSFRLGKMSFHEHFWNCLGSCCVFKRN